MERFFLWLLFAGVLCCILLGQGGAAFAAAGEAAGEAVTLTLGLVGGCALFGGLIRMADAAGLSRSMARLLRKPLRFLFPGIEA